MIRNTLAYGFAAAGAMLLLGACGADERPTAPVSVITEIRTVTASVSPSPMTSAVPREPVEATAPAVAPEPTAVVDTPSFTCGDLRLYQRGTAVYSDGSTGYEQSCDVPGGENPYGPNTRGDATQAPGSFVPGSGDGYGPNQVLPPLCVRFPDMYGPCPGS